MEYSDASLTTTISATKYADLLRTVHKSPNTRLKTDLFLFHKQNLAVCALHLGKPTSRFVNQMKTLAPKPAAISMLEVFETQFDAANATYVGA